MFKAKISKSIRRYIQLKQEIYTIESTGIPVSKEDLADWLSEEVSFLMFAMELTGGLDDAQEYMRRAIGIIRERHGIDVQPDGNKNKRTRR